MRHFAIVTGFVLAGLLCGQALAEGTWFTYHEFTGQGWANVFDDGPVVSDAESGSGGPEADRFFFSALDLTRPGSLGASASAFGSSWIGPWKDNGIRLIVDFHAEYIPSLSPGGDNPGGAAEGALFSVIEFVMPVDELIWGYQLRIRDTIEFDGETRVLFENVTQNETVFDLTTEVFPPIETTLTGNSGDLMRFTSTMSGAGNSPGGSIRQYDSFFSSTFILPEPETLLLMLVGVLAARARGRTRVGQAMK